jgi:uncharacterized protein
MEPKLSSEAEHAVHFREFIHRLAQKFDPLQILSFSQNSYTNHSQGNFNNDQHYYLKCFHCVPLSHFPEYDVKFAATITKKNGARLGE